MNEVVAWLAVRGSVRSLGIAVCPRRKEQAGPKARRARRRFSCPLAPRPRGIRGPCLVGSLAPVGHLASLRRVTHSFYINRGGTTVVINLTRSPIREPGWRFRRWRFRKGQLRKMTLDDDIRHDHGDDGERRRYRENVSHAACRLALPRLHGREHCSRLRTVWQRRGLFLHMP